MPGIIRSRKIRNRSTSSSTSSTATTNCSAKSGFWISKRGRTSKINPTSKMKTRSLVSRLGSSESSKKLQTTSGENVTSISARKLAATLWKMDRVHSSTKRGFKKRDENEKIHGFSKYLNEHFYRVEGVDEAKTYRRRRMSGSLQKEQFNEEDGEAQYSTGSFSLMEVEIPFGENSRRSKDPINDISISDDRKILNRIQGLGENNFSSTSLVHALLFDLKQARIQIDQLIRKQIADRNKRNSIIKRFSLERSLRKRREEETIRVAIQSISSYLEVEKKLRRKLEILNAKLCRELSETEASLSMAIKELNYERRSREKIERLYDELVRLATEDKARVEEIKKQSVRLLKELEKEREMLQIADVLREERARMKLSEAQFQLEEKNTAVDNLRKELEIFMAMNSIKESLSIFRNPRDKTETLRKSHWRNDESTPVPDDWGEMSESDLHSIDLHVENNQKN